jgi:hypothetical protein
MNKRNCLVSHYRDQLETKEYTMGDNKSHKTENI